MTPRNKDALEALNEWDAFRGQERAGGILLKHLDTLRTALTAPSQAWLPIDGFPQTYKEFLFYDGEYIWQGFMEWHKYDGYYWVNMAGSEIKPTHFMPLPPPPVKDALDGGG